MTTDALRVRIDNALAQAEFTDVYGRRLNAHLMRQLYRAKQNCVLVSTEAISVPRPELGTLVSELDACLGSYKSPSGTVGNGLYLLTGTSGSPRLPSSEDYAKVFVLVGARHRVVRGLAPRQTGPASLLRTADGDRNARSAGA